MYIVLAKNQLNSPRSYVVIFTILTLTLYTSRCNGLLSSLLDCFDFRQMSGPLLGEAAIGGQPRICATCDTQGHCRGLGDAYVTNVESDLMVSDCSADERTSE